MIQTQKINGTCRFRLFYRHYRYPKHSIDYQLEANHMLASPLCGQDSKVESNEELELDPPKEKEEIQIEELAVDGICGVY